MVHYVTFVPNMPNDKDGDAICYDKEWERTLKLPVGGPLAIGLLAQAKR